MQDQIQSARRVRFAEFEADFEQRELFKSGKRRPLQHKPFRILELLLRRPGCVVTRQELANDLWPGLRVSFEHSLNTAVNSLRLALGDSPRESRFVETRPGVGYRFIATVQDYAPTSDYDAAQICLRAHYFLDKMTAADTHKAIAHFQAALIADPEFAAAHAGIAEAYALLALEEWARAADVAIPAQAHASHAVRHESRLAEAHLAQARMKMTFAFDLEGARNDCCHALELAPRSADVYLCRAALSSAVAAHDEALANARRACALEPLSLAKGAALAWHLYLARDFAAAADQCWRVLTLEPRFAYAQKILGLAYEQQGDYAAATTELENARHCSDDDQNAAAVLAHVYARSGDYERALATCEQFGAASTYCLAIVYCGLADYRRALELLKQACRERDPQLLWLQVDPRLDPLRTYSAFLEVLRRIGYN